MTYQAERFIGTRVYHYTIGFVAGELVLKYPMVDYIVIRFLGIFIHYYYTKYSVFYRKKTTLNE